MFAPIIDDTPQTDFNDEILAVQCEMRESLLTLAMIASQRQNMGHDWPSSFLGNIPKICQRMRKRSTRAPWHCKHEMKGDVESLGTMDVCETWGVSNNRAGDKGCMCNGVRHYTCIPATMKNFCHHQTILLGHRHHVDYSYWVWDQGYSPYMPSGQLDYFLLDKIRLLLGKQIVQKQCVWRFARDGQFFEALCHSIVGSLWEYYTLKWVTSGHTVFSSNA